MAGPRGGCGRERGLFLAKVGVVAANPIFANRSEEVIDDAVFEEFDAVGDMGRDLDHVAGSGFDGLVGKDELHAAGDDQRELLVEVVMFGDDGALLDLEAGDGHVGGMDMLTHHLGVHLFAGNSGPMMELHKSPMLAFREVTCR